MEKEKIDLPTLDQVKDWTKKDLAAAGYFLSMLQRYPEIVDKCAEMIYEHVRMTENGSAIDTAKPSKSVKYAKQ